MSCERAGGGADNTTSSASRVGGGSVSPAGMRMVTEDQRLRRYVQTSRKSLLPILIQSRREEILKKYEKRSCPKYSSPTKIPQRITRSSSQGSRAFSLSEVSSGKRTILKPPNHCNLSSLFQNKVLPSR